MKAVQQEALLTVIEFAIVSQNSIETAVMTSECLILFDVNNISESIGSGEIVFCPRIVDGRVFVIVDIHPGFAFHPAGVVPVHTHGKCYTQELAFSLNSVDDRIAAAFRNRCS